MDVPIAGDVGGGVADEGGGDCGVHDRDDGNGEGKEFLGLGKLEDTCFGIVGRAYSGPVLWVGRVIRLEFEDSLFLRRIVEIICREGGRRMIPGVVYLFYSQPFIYIFCVQVFWWY